MAKRERNRLCAHNGCFERRHRFTDKTRGLFCKTHKLPEIVTLTTNPPRPYRGCAYEGVEGCGVQQPVYNTPGQTKGLYCKRHSLRFPGMVDVVSKKCAYEGCGKQPSFNTPGQTNGLYCEMHSLPGMVNVKGKGCAHKTCNVVHPVFNTPDQRRGLYCEIHKKPGMANVMSALYCKKSICKEHQPPGLNVKYVARAPASAR